MKVPYLALVQERMRTHNLGYAHILLNLFIVIQKTTLRFFNNYSLRALVYYLQTQFP